MIQRLFSAFLLEKFLEASHLYPSICDLEAEMNEQRKFHSSGDVAMSEDHPCWSSSPLVGVEKPLRGRESEDAFG